jgi:hypothetical protein
VVSGVSANASDEQKDAVEGDVADGASAAAHVSDAAEGGEVDGVSMIGY